jgi:hypothetical protein
VSLWFFLVVATLATARSTRLVYKDSIFEAPREALVNWLEDEYHVGATDSQGVPVPGTITRKRFAGIRVKLAELITCPYCVSAYTSAAVLILWRIFVWPFPAPVFMWLAVWMLAVVVLEYTDGEE